LATRTHADLFSPRNKELSIHTLRKIHAGSSVKLPSVPDAVHL
jgi:hypothetical protein